MLNLAVVKCLFLEEVVVSCDAERHNRVLCRKCLPFKQTLAVRATAFTVKLINTCETCESQSIGKYLLGQEGKVRGLIEVQGDEATLEFNVSKAVGG